MRSDMRRGSASGGSRLTALVGAALVVGTVALVGTVAFVRRDRLAPPGEEIVYEDFGFSVVGVREATALGQGDARVRSSGVFRVVSLRVANHAIEVPYRMDQHRAILCEADGTVHPVAAGAQAALQSGECVPRRAEIQAGEECVEELAFDVPRDARGLTLRITWGGPLINVLDFAIFGNRRLVVPDP